ncbi:tapasin-related protein [Astyanax mexicanus]|uniref:Dehydrogenase/reductase (SDR family) member 13b.2 n=1 Tax=Astyanax mexicanus TaxID=7994 RepID=W5KNI5_ASTMX|nr:tapasin-related protein [Astyanax mexicanus]
MSVVFGGLFLAVLASAVCLCGSQSLRDVQWLPCPFVDESISLNEEGHRETKYHHKNGVLQFGVLGDRPINPDVVTFLVITSKVDMRRYVEGNVDMLQCEIRRYSTGGIVMRWPGLGAQEHDIWFTCTFTHTEGQFITTTFLRHTPAQEANQDWIQISDREHLTTSAAMVILTRTPKVVVGLMKDPTLSCQFAVDHKQANMTVEWRLQRRGERTKLFSYFTRTGKSEGSGVSVKAIGVGDASLKLSHTTYASEGTYVCSVLVPPLYGSHDIQLNIQEAPRVSVNVGSSLSLTLGMDQKVMCDAEGYYPLDVNIEWLREPVGSSFLPEILKNVLYSSHRHNKDGTFSLSAFFMLKPGLEDSGYKYTCRVTHQALLTPIRKSFTLTVSEQDSTLWYITVVGFILVMIILLFWLIPQLIAAKKRSERKAF